jgi:hypothetical protein
MRALTLTALLVAAAPLAAAPELVDVKKIWDKAPHNAFTDLLRHKGEWFCVFREGRAHVSPDGALRVLVSKDGTAWESAALITSSEGDLRDAKITLTPAGKLMLCGAVAYPKGGKHTHQSLAWFSDDGRTWSEPVKIGEPDHWLWRVTWHEQEALGVGYATDPKGVSKLYRSTDGKSFEVWVPKFVTDGWPTEASVLFRKDGSALCLHRRDGATPSGLLGVARPGYRNWKWKDLKARIGGPQLIEHADGRLFAVVRLYDKPVRTSVCTLDADKGELTEVVKLPSGGDTSYAGLAWHDGLLWVSYYSSHEGKTSIYLAKVKP